MMSQMSKYAMPSSTPLYHNAIKTIATSDDELLPDRPLLPPPPPPQGSGPGARRESLLWEWQQQVCLGIAPVDLRASASFHSLWSWGWCELWDPVTVTTIT